MKPQLKKGKKKLERNERRNKCKTEAELSKKTKRPFKDAFNVKERPL
jgi:hypothetical protein